MNDAPILKTEGLGKDYGDLVAVKALDLEVERGSFFGLLGPNGAGKTTAISMICGVVTPSRGSVRVAGHDPREGSFEARRSIGLVPQDLAVYDELSARQNLAFFGKMYGLGGTDLAEATERVLGIAGLADRSTERVEGFSGGMKRRLNMAVGLIHDPALLICDEPTVGVDPQSRAHVFDALRELNDKGMTILYTSHYMEEVQELCERVGVMDGGRMIAQGTMEELLGQHGGDVLVLEVDGDAAAVSAALPGSEIQGNRLTMPPPESLHDVVKTVEAHGAHLRTLEVKRSDLESVFLNLTGRGLRDESR